MTLMCHQVNTSLRIALSCEWICCTVATNPALMFLVQQTNSNDANVKITRDSSARNYTEAMGGERIS